MLKDVVAFVPAVLCQFLRPMQFYRTTLLRNFIAR